MTCTILCRDIEGGFIGGGVISHFPCVGHSVLAVEAGVGVVAGQSFAVPNSARQGLGLLALGHCPSQVVSELLHSYPPSRSQFGVLDVCGGVEVFTGGGCVPWAGEHRGEGEGVVVLGNMLVSPAVVEAAVEAFAQCRETTAERLIAALRAAEAAGGDVRGPQSAAIALVPLAEHSCEQIYIHIDDHLDPVGELARVLSVKIAHDAIADASSLAATGRLDDARLLFDQAQRTYGPSNLEPTVWGAIALARAGHLAEAMLTLDDVYRVAPHWRQFVERACTVGIAPDEIARAMPSPPERQRLRARSTITVRTDQP